MIEPKWAIPDSSRLEGKALAPMFTVQAIKSHRPAEGSVSYKFLLAFKRKQVITVLDWDEKRDAIYGEYDGKRGWFPSSYAKIISSTPQTPNSPSGEEAISSAASKRNAVPIKTEGRGSYNESVAELNSAPTSPQTSSFVSPRVLGTLLSPILPSINLEETRKKFTNISRGHQGKTNGQGLPLIVVDVPTHASHSNMIARKKLFKEEGEGEKINALLESYRASDSVDLSKYSPEVVLGAYKQFVLDLPEPLMTFDLFLSFTAASDIEEDERREAQFGYLLEMIPLQYFNMALCISRFLRDCTNHSDKNGFDVEEAAEVFHTVFCRPQGSDRADKQKQKNVAKNLISHCNSLFREALDASDKKMERLREQRRKKEREMMVSYNRNENKRAKKEERKKGKLRKKLPVSESEVVPVVDVPSKDEKSLMRSLSSDNLMRILPRGALSMNSLRTRANVSSVPGSRTSSSSKVSGNEEPEKSIKPPPVPAEIPPTEAPIVKQPPPPTTPAKPSPAHTISKFYQIGFYVTLIVFVITHFLRTVL